MQELAEGRSVGSGVDLAEAGTAAVSSCIQGDSDVEDIAVVLPSVKLAIDEVGVGGVNKGCRVDDVVAGVLLVIGDGEGSDWVVASVADVEGGEAKAWDLALAAVSGPVVSSLEGRKRNMNMSSKGSQMKLRKFMNCAHP